MTTGRINQVNIVQRKEIDSTTSNKYTPTINTHTTTRTSPRSRIHTHYQHILAIIRRFALLPITDNNTNRKSHPCNDHTCKTKFTRTINTQRSKICGQTIKSKLIQSMIQPHNSISFYKTECAFPEKERNNLQVHAFTPH
jgi:hypothetical protein